MTDTDDMRAILAADAEMTSYLPGRIWDRPLNPADPDMKDVVWVAHPVTGVKRLVPCAVLLEPQEVDSPFGLNPGRRLDTDIWPELVFYAPLSEWSAIEQADERGMELLHNQLIGTTDISATGYRARPLEADELPGDVWSTLRRYRGQRSRHIAGV
jgi:hypothetical protein